LMRYTRALRTRSPSFMSCLIRRMTRSWSSPLRRGESSVVLVIISLQRL
jgi:hypothetical protein